MAKGRKSTVVDGKKRCTRCEQTLPVSEFGIRVKDGKLYYQSRCRPCASTTTQQWLKVPKNRRAFLDRQKLRDRQKERVRRMAREAIKVGTLVRQPCERCGSSTVQAHHDDYSKPLDVRWLCRKDHMALHREEREAKLRSTISSTVRSAPSET